MQMQMSIDEYIKALQELKEKSPLGGDTVICLCLPYIEYLPLDNPTLDVDGDGAIILIKSEKAEEYIGFLTGEKIKPKLDTTKYPDIIECLKPGSRYAGACKGTAHKRTKGLFGPDYHPERGPWYGCAACGCLAQYQDFMDHRQRQ